MKYNPVGWFEIYVKDMDRAKSFYENVLGIKLDKMPMPDRLEGGEMYGFPNDMEASGASGALTKWEGFGPSDKGTIVHFNCDDCAVEESRIEANGGKVLQSKTDIGEYGFSVLFSDSEGNTLGLHSMK